MMRDYGKACKVTYPVIMMIGQFFLAFLDSKRVSNKRKISIEVKSGMIVNQSLPYSNSTLVLYKNTQTQSVQQRIQTHFQITIQRQQNE